MWLFIELDRWSSYIVTIVWEFAWADSALMILDEWSSYGGGCLKRLDSNVFYSLYFLAIPYFSL